MANYSELIATINDQIKANGNQEITGPVLNAVLQAMVSALGEGYQFLGVATPDTNPGAPDAKVFYIATQNGVYTNFSNIQIKDELAILINNVNGWNKIDTGLLINNLGAEKGISEVELTEGHSGYYINAGGVEVQSRTEGAIVYTLTVNPGDTYMLETLSLGAASRVVSFYNGDIWVGSYFQGEGKSGIYRFVIPDIVDKIKICVNDNYDNKLVLLQNVINNIFERINYTCIAYNSLLNKDKCIVLRNGEMAEQAGWGATDYIPISYVREIEVRAQKGSTAGMAFYSEKDETTFISTLIPTYNLTSFTKINVPQNAKFFRISTSLSNMPLQFLVRYNSDLSSISETVEDIVQTDVNYLYPYQEISPDGVQDDSYINTGGAVISGASGSHVATFNVSENDKYYTAIETRGAGAIVIAFYKGGENVTLFGRGTSALQKYTVTVPEGVDEMKIVYDTSRNAKGLYVYKNVDTVGKNEQEELASLKNEIKLSYQRQIYQNNYIRKSKADGFKMLYFGSSHGMCTWWYLNKILQSAGINATLKCFYQGGASFQEWCTWYEDGSSVYNSNSVNGNDWTGNNSSFKAALNEGDWDLIGFQQGAANSIKWDSFEDAGGKLLSYVARNAKNNTQIAVNLGIPPAKTSEWLSQYGGYEVSENGQNNWMDDSNSNYARFCQFSGITKVSPNSAMMYALRHNTDIADSADLADDGVHPNNGLPCYALAALFFETYIAPIFDVSIKDITWLPDESTQKNLVSGDSWDAIDENKRIIICNTVKLALSDIYGKPTL